MSMSPEQIDDEIFGEAQELINSKGFIIIKKNTYKKTVKVLKQALTEVNEAMIDNDESWKELSDNIYKLLHKELKEL